MAAPAVCGLTSQEIHNNAVATKKRFVPEPRVQDARHGPRVGPRGKSPTSLDRPQVVAPWQQAQGIQSDPRQSRSPGNRTAVPKATETEASMMFSGGHGLDLHSQQVCRKGAGACSPSRERSSVLKGGEVQAPKDPRSGVAREAPGPTRRGAGTFSPLRPRPPGSLPGTQRTSQPTAGLPAGKEGRLLSKGIERSCLSPKQALPMRALAPPQNAWDEVRTTDPRRSQASIRMQIHKEAREELEEEASGALSRGVHQQSAKLLKQVQAARKAGRGGSLLAPPTPAGYGLGASALEDDHFAEGAGHVAEPGAAAALDPPPSQAPPATEKARPRTTSLPPSLPGPGAPDAVLDEAPARTAPSPLAERSPAPSPAATSPLAHAGSAALSAPWPSPAGSSPTGLASVASSGSSPSKPSSPLARRSLAAEGATPSSPTRAAPGAGPLSKRWPSGLLGDAEPADSPAGLPGDWPRKLPEDAPWKMLAARLKADQTPRLEDAPKQDAPKPEADALANPEMTRLLTEQPWKRLVSPGSPVDLLSKERGLPMSGQPPAPPGGSASALGPPPPGEARPRPPGLSGEAVAPPGGSAPASADSPGKAALERLRKRLAEAEATPPAAVSWSSQQVSPSQGLLEAGATAGSLLASSPASPSRGLLDAGAPEGSLLANVPAGSLLADSPTLKRLLEERATLSEGPEAGSSKSLLEKLERRLSEQPESTPVKAPSNSALDRLEKRLYEASPSTPQLLLGGASPSTPQLLPGGAQPPRGFLGGGPPRSAPGIPLSAGLAAGGADAGAAEAEVAPGVGLWAEILAKRTAAEAAASAARQAREASSILEDKPWKALLERLKRGSGGEA